MELNTISQSDFTKLANVLWGKAYESVPQVMRKSGLVKEVPISANSGNTREFSEIDGEEFAKLKSESDQAARARVQQGYSKTMYQKRVALDIGISYEMRTQNKYPEVVSRLTNLGTQVAKRLELDLAHRISFAASTSYTDMDGQTVDVSVGDTLALASSVHTLRGSSSTFRNILANNPKLSKGALEGMERLVVEETLNQFGEKKTMAFDILWTTDDPNTVNTAREHLQATAEVSAANAGVPNVYQSKYRHVVLPYVATTAAGAVDSTKRYFWGLASSAMSCFYLGMWEEPHMKAPSAGNNGEDFSTDDWNYGARGGYGIVIPGASWFKLSKGDGTA
ncbi:MAG: hypothetical protein RI965_349 [Bacteroidota bacterium]|jgi:hypothetical protein